MPNIRDELTRLKDAAEREALIGIDEKRAMLAEIILTPAWNLDPESSLAQYTKTRRRTLSDGTIEEDITVRMPCKLRAMELDTKLSGELSHSGKRQDGDTWKIVEERIREAQQRCPSSFGKYSIDSIKNIHEQWTECEHDPFDGKKKKFLKLLEKVIEFGHECRFMDSNLSEIDLDEEIIAETEKRKKREERQKK
tara:strand:- start:47 stop:631 length:585 start_codon:yes stop_codon:yes gene_type:complete